jgi:bifunctional non-homologous end joining protein LigD
MLLRPGLPPASARDQWALEVKWDGMRAQFRVARDGIWCVRSRPGRNCSDQFPELARVADALHGHDMLLDGELVCLDHDGRPDFHRLRRRLTSSDAHAAFLLAAGDPVTLIVFDVLHLDGRALRALPYHRRRELLAPGTREQAPGRRRGIAALHRRQTAHKVQSQIPPLGIYL